MSKRELFVLSPDVFHAMSPDEVDATAADMRELGIFNLPYERIDLRWRIWVVDTAAPDAMGFSGPGMDDSNSQLSVMPPKWQQSAECEGINCDTLSMTMVGLNRDGEIDGIIIHRKGRALHFPKGQIKHAEFIWGPQGAKLLIVLLATRGAEKTVTINKLAKLGIGKKKNAYARTTTISISHDLQDDAEHAPTGATKIPHLRRGHIRNQKYGPQRAFIKRIWIEPMFVNADPSFVSQRRGYNFSMSAVDLPKGVDDVSIVNKILNPDVEYQSHENRKEPAGFGD